MQFVVCVVYTVYVLLFTHTHTENTEPANKTDKEYFNGYGNDWQLDLYGGGGDNMEKGVIVMCMEATWMNCDAAIYSNGYFLEL